ncbi:MAG: acetyl-CoA carboxylase carboxyltransferase subunit alpha [Rhabdochlamydiaceae bacterium]|nr:acetyl-CoA carboxylase carboxyltransferase subunit alpha [Rhabdochlamydiaceae bacterium]
MLAHEKQIAEYQKLIEQLKGKNQSSALWSDEELVKLEEKLEELKDKVYSDLTPWDRVSISRHPSRPKSLDYIRNICESFTEIFGDRLFADDHAIIAGFAKIGGVKFMVIAQEKGNDTQSRIHRNFGMPHPEGYRKAMRCMRLAAKFKLPVLSLLDTPGAYPGLSAEERGQGWAIANNMWEMARLPTPIIVLLIGEGCSGGAIGMGVGDVIGMLEHAYYSVISPEGCASILFKDTSKNEQAASMLKIHVEELLKLGIVDSMISEPPGGAHQDPAMVYQGVKKFIAEQWDFLKRTPIESLLEQRYQKFRKLGKFAVEEKPDLV